MRISRTGSHAIHLVFQMTKNGWLSATLFKLLTFKYTTHFISFPTNSSVHNGQYIPYPYLQIKMPQIEFNTKHIVSIAKRVFMHFMSSPKRRPFYKGLNVLETQLNIKADSSSQSLLMFRWCCRVLAILWCLLAFFFYCSRDILFVRLHYNMLEMRTLYMRLVLSNLYQSVLLIRCGKVNWWNV